MLTYYHDKLGGKRFCHMLLYYYVSLLTRFWGVTVVCNCHLSTNSTGRA